MLRALIVAALVAALGWSAYWFVGSRRLDHEVETWLEGRRAEGWVAEADISVAGFPNRFDLTLTGLELADPDSGLAWSTPFLQLLTLSYRPDHIIAVWPNEQIVSTPLERVTIRGDDIRASLHVADTRTLALDEATFVSEGVTFVSDAGWSAALDTGRLAVERTEAANTYRIGFEALGLTPIEAVKRRLDPARGLPDTIETLKLDTEVAFDAPWDRAAIEEARPQPTAIDLRELRATWGELDFRAVGAVTVAPDGTPEGQITVRAENWRDMLDLGVASGAVPAALAPTITRALEMLARSSGSPDTLDAALTFRNGRVFYGLIPLGPVPRLILR